MRKGKTASLHHVLLAHGSHPSRPDDRRIGHFDLAEGPTADLDDDAMAMHADSTARLQAAVYSGTDNTESRD